MMSPQPTPVDEQAATGETARIYHDIRQTLRVSGVNLNFRTWAGFDRFFPLMWRAMRDVAATGPFEAAADDVRAHAVRAAAVLPSLDAVSQVSLGDSQRFQIQAALELYHYINPKLLVFTSIVARTLERLSAGAMVPVTADRLPRGVPAAMFPMEMVDERPNERRIRSLFDDIKRTMQLSSVNSDYRTLAMWPDYLDAAWRRLKPLVKSPAYEGAATVIGTTAKTHARELVQHVAFDRRELERSGENVDAVIKTTARFERLLPPLILNIAMVSLDWSSAEQLARSPFPVGAASPDANSVGR